MNNYSFNRDSHFYYDLRKFINAYYNLYRRNCNYN